MLGLLRLRTQEASVDSKLDLIACGTFASGADSCSLFLCRWFYRFQSVILDLHQRYTVLTTHLLYIIYIHVILDGVGSTYCYISPDIYLQSGPTPALSLSIYTHTYIHLYIYTYIYTPVYIYTYIYIYVYIHMII